MLNNLGDQTVKDLNTGVALNITEFLAGLNSLLDRLDGATVTVTIQLRPWTPKATS